MKSSNQKLQLSSLTKTPTKQKPEIGSPTNPVELCVVTLAKIYFHCLRGSLNRRVPHEGIQFGLDFAFLRVEDIRDTLSDSAGELVQGEFLIDTLKFFAVGAGEEGSKEERRVLASLGDLIELVLSRELHGFKFSPQLWFKLLPDTQTGPITSELFGTEAMAKFGEEELKILKGVMIRRSTSKARGSSRGTPDHSKVKLMLRTDANSSTQYPHIVPGEKSITTWHKQTNSIEDQYRGLLTGQLSNSSSQKNLFAMEQSTGFDTQHNRTAIVSGTSTGKRLFFEGKKESSIKEDPSKKLRPRRGPVFKPKPQTTLKTTPSSAIPSPYLPLAGQTKKTNTTLQINNSKDSFKDIATMMSGPRSSVKSGQGERLYHLPKSSNNPAFFQLVSDAKAKTKFQESSNSTFQAFGDKKIIFGKDEASGSKKLVKEEYRTTDRLKRLLNGKY